MLTTLIQAYHQHAKGVRLVGAWLGFALVVLAGVLESVPEFSGVAPIAGLLLWAGTGLAGTVFLRQAETAFGKWLAGGGGLALAAGGQYLLQAFPGNKVAEVLGMLAMGVGGLWKGALTNRPNVARASVPPSDADSAPKP